MKIGVPPYPYNDWTIPFDEEMDRLNGGFDRVKHSAPDKLRGHEINLIKDVETVLQGDWSRRQNDKRLDAAIRAHLAIQSSIDDETPELEELRAAYKQWKGKR